MEEWNEYGELKEKVGSGTPAPPTSSVPSTPSKASSLTQTPTQNASLPSQSLAESPLTTAMRRVGLEAAKRANESKSQGLSSTTKQTSVLADKSEKLDTLSSTEAPANSGTTVPSSQPISEGHPPTAGSATSNEQIPSELSEKSTTESNKIGSDTGNADAETSRGKANFQPSSEHSEPTAKSSTLSESKSGKGAEIEREYHGAIDENDNEVESVEGVKGAEKTGGHQLVTAAAQEPSLLEDKDPVLEAIQRGKTGGPLLDHRKLNAGNNNEQTNEQADEQTVKETQNQPAASPQEAGESVGD